MRKIAVASSDGINVDTHFGRADHFYIVSFNDDLSEVTTLEKRSVDPICQGGSHYEPHLWNKVEQIKDCDYVLVSRIGQRAAQELSKYGIEAYELPGEIDAGIEEIWKYQQIQQLFQ